MTFKGFKAATVDFQAKRGQSAAPLQYIDIDLGVARNFANALNLDVAGNLFYVDQDPQKVGFATCFFGDGSTKGGTPIYVGSGFLSKVDFVKLTFTNVLQPGKILRVIYGTDVDFTPGMSPIAIVQSAGTVNGSQPTGGFNIGPADSGAVITGPTVISGVIFTAGPNGSLLWNMVRQYDANLPVNSAILMSFSAVTPGIGNIFFTPTVVGRAALPGQRQFYERDSDVYYLPAGTQVFSYIELTGTASATYNFAAIAKDL
jgi:hypothetical protein